MSPVKSRFPWELVIYLVLAAGMMFVIFTMYRGGQGGGVMNVGRAKVKDQHG